MAESDASLAHRTTTPFSGGIAPPITKPFAQHPAIPFSGHDATRNLTPFARHSARRLSGDLAARIATPVAPMNLALTAPPPDVRPTLPPPRSPGALIRVPPPIAPVAGVAAFWSRVSAHGAPDPFRLSRALAVLEASPALRLTAPQPEALARLAARHGAAIQIASRGTLVSPALMLAVIAVHSDGSANAGGLIGVQSTGLPRTGITRRVAAPDPVDTERYLRASVASLDWLLRRYDGDVILALAAHNAGEGAVLRAGGVPPFGETRAYVPRVLAAWRAAIQLCRFPPVLPTDLCTLSDG